MTAFAHVVERYVAVAVVEGVDLDGSVEEELVQVDVDAVSEEANAFADVYGDLVSVNAKVHSAVHHVTEVEVVAVKSQNERVIPEDVENRPKQCLFSFKVFDLAVSRASGSCLRGRLGA